MSKRKSDLSNLFTELAKAIENLAIAFELLAKDYETEARKLRKKNG